MSNSPKVKLIDLSQYRALQIVQAASKDSARVFYTAHARQRMRQRRITPTQVMRCLAHGRISEGPVADKMKGGWKCTVEHYSAGDAIGVSVGIETMEAEAITIITVFHVN